MVRNFNIPNSRSCLSHALLAEEDRPAVVALDEDGDDGDDRAGEHQQGRRDDDVEGPLERQVDLGEGARLDVEQRLVGDGRSLDPTGVDARQAGMEQELAAAALLLAHQGVEQRWAEVG